MRAMCPRTRTNRTIWIPAYVYGAGLQKLRPCGPLGPWWFESTRAHWLRSPSPICGLGYSGVLLNLPIHGALKADEQLLIQHGGDRRQLRDVRALLEP